MSSPHNLFCKRRNGNPGGVVLLFLSSFMIWVGGRALISFAGRDERRRVVHVRTGLEFLAHAFMSVRGWKTQLLSPRPSLEANAVGRVRSRREASTLFLPFSSSLFCFRFPSLPSHPLLFLCVCTNFTNVGRENRFIRMPPPPECHEQNILVLHVYINKFQNLMNLSSLRPPDSRDPCCAPSYNPFTLFPSVVA